MSNYLKASEYLQSSKYELVPQNTYDTISGTEVLSSQSKSTSLTGSVSIVSTDISSITWTNKSSQKNIGHWGTFNTGQSMGKSLVAVKTKEYTVTLTSSGQAISSKNCRATFSLKGSQWSVASDDVIYNISDIDEIENVDEWTDWSNPDALVTEVKISAYKKDDWTGDSDYVKYSAERVPMFGFLKDGAEYLSDVQFTSSRDIYGTLRYKPTWTDTEITSHMPSSDLVITRWMPTVEDTSSIITYQNFHALADDWEFNGSHNTGGTLPVSGTTWQVRRDLSNYDNNPYTAMITYKSLYEPFSVWYEQISDYSIKVHFTIPIAYVYAAASAYTTQTYLGILYKHACDSTIFYNETTSVDVTLECGQQGTDTSNFSYSIDDAGNLTTAIDNVNILNLSGSELITDLATIKLNGSTGSWKEKLSLAILTEYSNGKTTFECKVPAEVGYTKNFKINDLYYIKKQDGSSITRGYKATPFVLKNITKSLEQGSFTWTLKFLEGPKSRRLNELGDSLILPLEVADDSLVLQEVTGGIEDTAWVSTYACGQESTWFWERLNDASENKHCRYSSAKGPFTDSYVLIFDDTLLAGSTLDNSYAPIILSTTYDGTSLVSVLSYSLYDVTESDITYGRISILCRITSNVELFRDATKPPIIVGIRVFRPINTSLLKGDAYVQTNFYGASLFGLCLKLPQKSDQESSSASVETALQSLCLEAENFYDPNKYKIAIVNIYDFKSTLSHVQLYILKNTTRHFVLRNSGGVVVSGNSLNFYKSLGINVFVCGKVYAPSLEDLKTGITPVHPYAPFTYGVNAVYTYIYIYKSADFVAPKEFQ